MPKIGTKQTKQNKQRSAGVVKLARAIVRTSNAQPMQISHSLGRGGRVGSAALYTKTVPQMRTLELKSVDTANATYTLNTTGQFTVLNVPVNGAAFYNRIGNEIEMKSLHLIGNITATANAGSAPGEYARIMVVYDRQPNGAAPSTADLLTSYASAGTTTSTVFDHLNPNNKERFLVLMDDRLAFADSLKATAANAATQGAVDFSKNEVNINRFIKLRGLTTRYKASTGAIGDISIGSLLLFTFGSIAAGTEAYGVNLSARLRFTD